MYAYWTSWAPILIADVDFGSIANHDATEGLFYSRKHSDLHGQAVSTAISILPEPIDDWSLVSTRPAARR